MSKFRVKHVSEDGCEYVYLQFRKNLIWWPVTRAMFQSPTFEDEFGELVITKIFGAGCGYNFGHLSSALAWVSLARDYAKKKRQDAIVEAQDKFKNKRRVQYQPIPNEQ